MGVRNSTKSVRPGKTLHAAVASRRRTRTSPRDVISVLEADHTKIKALLSMMQKARTTTQREALVEKTGQILKEHTRREERIFYPAFREAAKTKRDRQLFHEATEEHYVVDLVLPEVKQAVHEPDVFAARAKVLKELVEHHIEEEQDDMFPRARRLLSIEQRRALGDEMLAPPSAADRAVGALHSVGAMIGLST